MDLVSKSQELVIWQYLFSLWSKKEEIWLEQGGRKEMLRKEMLRKVDIRIQTEGTHREIAE